MHFAYVPGAADPEGHQLLGPGRAAPSPSSVPRAPASPPSRGCCSASTSRPAGRILVDGQDIAEVQPGFAQGGDRHGPAGHGAVQRHDRLQHPLRALGGRRGGGRGGLAPGPDRPLHRDPARGLRHACRRAWPQTVGRREAARRDRPHDPEGAADPDPRRGDLGARFLHREGDPGRARPGLARTHHDRHRAPPLDRDRRRRDHRARWRPDRRAGQRMPISCAPRASMRRCGIASARPTKPARP